MRELTVKIPANEKHPIEYLGDFARVKSTAWAFNLQAGDSRVIMDAGSLIRLPVQTEKWFIENTQPTELTVTIVIGNGGDYEEAVVTGSFYTTSPYTLEPAADVALTSGAETLISAANSNRINAVITAIDTNTVNVRIGKTGAVSASQGIPLAPGEKIVLSNVSALYAYTTAAAQKINVCEELK